MDYLILGVLILIGGLLNKINHNFNEIIEEMKENKLKVLEVFISVVTFVAAFYIGYIQNNINQRGIDLNYFPGVSITFDEAKIETGGKADLISCDNPISINIKNLGLVGVIVSEIHNSEFTDLKLGEKIFISPSDNYSYNINVSSKDLKNNFCKYLLTKFRMNGREITRIPVSLILETPEKRLYEAELIFVIESQPNGGTRFRMYVANIKRHIE